MLILLAADKREANRAKPVFPQTVQTHCGNSLHRHTFISTDFKRFTNKSTRCFVPCVFLSQLTHWNMSEGDGEAAALRCFHSGTPVVVHGSYNYSNYIPLLIGRRTLMTYVNKSALNAPPAARMSHRSDGGSEVIDWCSRFTGFYQFNRYIQKQGHYYNWTPGLK